MKKLTQARLKELLHYNPQAGVFIWKIPRQGINTSMVAGSVNKNDGYRRIQVDSKMYKASRLAFLYVEGYFPEYDVDHRDRVRLNDRWKNLRHVSRQCNTRNCKIRKDNTSGIAGVYWYKQTNRWKVEITVSGKKFSIGYFIDKFDAARARWNAEVKHSFPGCNTISTAYLYIQKHENQREIS